MFQTFSYRFSKKLFNALKKEKPCLLQFRRNFLDNAEKAKSMNTTAFIYDTENGNALKRILAEYSSKFNKNADHTVLYKNSHELVKEFLSDKKITFNIDAVADRNKELIDYNNIGSRYRRFKMFIETYRNLASKDMLSNEHILRVSVMAYLAEMMIHFFAVIDDVLDQANLRRNKLPWYKLAGVETINDTTLMYSGMLITMKFFFQNEPYYVPCFEILNEVTWIVAVSQSYDFRTFNIFDRYKEQLGMDMYKKLTCTKGTSNCFYQPVITAMKMADYDYSEFSGKLMKILDDLGYHLIMHNDYSDRYGKTTGKILDEDIRLGKLSWMVMKAMELANDSQKEIIVRCYGKKDTESVEAVINVYDQLKLEEVGMAHQKELFDSINKEISTLPNARVQKVMIYAQKMLEYWYKDL